jgi:hypothetical protein
VDREGRIVRLPTADSTQIWRKFRVSYQAHEGLTFVPLSRRAGRIRGPLLRGTCRGMHSRARPFGPQVGTLCARSVSLSLRGEMAVFLQAAEAE